MSGNKETLVFGTFDILHPGHVHFLRWASAFGRLTVALTPDSLCQYYKNYRPLNVYDKRRQRLLTVNYVSNVVSADLKPGSFKIINRLRPEIIVLGYDQRLLKRALIDKFRSLTQCPKLIISRPYRADYYKSSLFCQPEIRSI